MNDETVTYDKNEILKILRGLDILVVSTDRIGSAYFERENDDQYNAMFVRFFDDLRFFEKLAHARQVLSKPFPTAVGDDGMDELERNAQGLKYWGDVNFE